MALFKSFYEEVLVMVREGVPVDVLARKVWRAIPDHDSRKQFLGHLRDSLNHLEASGEDAAAHTILDVIELLEHMSQHLESGGRR
jgi:hemerythrin-like domain-containing protein